MQHNDVGIREEDEIKGIIGFLLRLVNRPSVSSTSFSSNSQEGKVEPLLSVPINRNEIDQIKLVITINKALENLNSKSNKEDTVIGHKIGILKGLLKHLLYEPIDLEALKKKNSSFAEQRNISGKLAKKIFSSKKSETELLFDKVSSLENVLLPFILPAKIHFCLNNLEIDNKANDVSLADTDRNNQLVRKMTQALLSGTSEECQKKIVNYFQQISKRQPVVTNTFKTLLFSYCRELVKDQWTIKDQTEQEKERILLVEQRLKFIAALVNLEVNLNDFKLNRKGILEYANSYTDKHIIPKKKGPQNFPLFLLLHGAEIQGEGIKMEFYNQITNTLKEKTPEQIKKIIVYLSHSDKLKMPEKISEGLFNEDNSLVNNQDIPLKKQANVGVKNENYDFLLKLNQISFHDLEEKINEAIKAVIPPKQEKKN